MFAAATTLFLLGAKDATFNHSIQWSEEEFKTYKPYAKRYHIPHCLLIALRKAENGGVDKEFGQISISSEIKLLDSSKKQQVAQAARTLSWAVIGFVAANPGFVRQYNWKPDEKTWEGYLWEYRTRFVNYLAFVGWAPEDNPKRWAANVLYHWEKEQERS